VPEVDVGPAHVVASGESGLKDHHRRRRVGEDNPLKLDPYRAVRTQRVHPHVGVARVDEDLFILFEPGIQRPHVTGGDLDVA